MSDRPGWGSVVGEYRRALVSGLDGLPMKSVKPVPLPEDHPDVLPVDSDEIEERKFKADMALLARSERDMRGTFEWRSETIPDEVLIGLAFRVRREFELDGLHVYYQVWREWWKRGVDMAAPLGDDTKVYVA